jgi:amidophosphoribosyltransferase
VAEIADIIGVDSLEFLSIDGLYRAVDEDGRNQQAPQYCDACFSGDYPISVTDNASSSPLFTETNKRA